MTEPTPPLPALADGAEQRLDPRHVTVERITGWIFTGVLAAAGLLGLIVALFVTRPGVVVSAAMVVAWIASGAAFGALSHYWPPASWRRASWRLDARGLEIRRGVVWREVVNVPRSRVQHTDVSQGPLERRFGLATLVVHTAGTELAAIQLPGLEHGTAMTIRDHLVAAGRDDAV
jgi:membrane protein YdbS with pleckstrin-like domain